MTDNDDTGQPAPLPLMERARLGLRIEETELAPAQIAELEFPKDKVGQTWWCGQIEHAIKAGQLAAHVEKTVTVIHSGARLTNKYRDGVWVPGSQTVATVSLSSHHQNSAHEKYLVPRDAYAGWRTGAAIFRKQPDTYIDLWLPLVPVSSPEKAAPASERTILGEMAHYLPLREKARLGCLPDALHVEQIATLEYPDNRDLALAYANALIDACDKKEMAFTRKQYEYWWIEDGATDEVSEEFGWWHKKLELGESGATPLIDKTAYRDWLLQKGLPLPTWWFPVAVTNPSTSTAPNPVVPTPSASVPGTGRQIALVEAEDAALTLLRKKLRREPDFEEFWFHITEHDDTGTVAESTDDRLMWIGKDGRNCETSKSTVRNRLAAAKKRNPFGR